MKYLIGCILLLCSQFVPAQSQDEIRITGTIIDKENGNAIGLSSVALRRIYTDDPGAVQSTFTVAANNQGKFTFHEIPAEGKYVLTITTIGYQTLVREIDASTALSSLLELGLIPLEKEARTLSTVTVTATSPSSMEFSIDRKVFNVNSNITSRGGTAIDVMKNIPGLSVDVEGNVEMRSSTPQIFIDGRPTILTLDQIAADDIERVELITNPSAKFDASGAGGIINIVLKKNKRAGLNGNLSLSAGTPSLFGGNLNLNLRQSKFNFFLSGNYNRSGGNITEETSRLNKMDGIVTDRFYQNSSNSRKRIFAGVRFGVDYFINDRNTLSLTQSFGKRDFGQDELQRQQYFDGSDELEYYGIRTADGSGDFKRMSSRLTYELKFSDPDHKLTADLNYNNGDRNSATITTNEFYYPDGSVYAPTTRVRDDGFGDMDQLTAQLDYSKKWDEDKRVELGLRSFSSSSKTTFDLYSLDPGGVESKLPLSTNYEYTEKINAAYINYAGKFNKVTWQAGLRSEFSDFDGKLVDSNLNFGYKFPNGFKDLEYALFPSLFLTVPLTESQDMQFNYSRRIRRPRFWQVNPFVDINDPLNIRRGNPELKPEYTNSFELNYFNEFGERKGSFLAVLYFRNNVGDITQFSDTISNNLYAQLNNAAISPDAILNTYINAGYTNRMGAEFTWQQKFGSRLDFMYNLDLQQRNTRASAGGIDLSRKGFTMETKLITNYQVASKLSVFDKLGMQLVLNYEAPQVIPQGKRKEEFVADFAMRKPIFREDRGTLTLSISDIFDTRRFGTIYDTERFYQDSYRRWDVRNFRLTFSYRFGDNDFRLGRNRGEQQNMNSSGFEQ